MIIISVILNMKRQELIFVCLVKDVQSMPDPSGFGGGWSHMLLPPPLFLEGQLKKLLLKQVIYD